MIPTYTLLEIPFYHEEYEVHEEKCKKAYEIFLVYSKLFVNFAVKNN